MSTHVSQCTFCDLIHGAAEVSMCYEDRDALAFMDIQPVNAGHVLVVPRQHFESLLDIPPQLALHLFRVAMQLAPVVRSARRPAGDRAADGAAGVMLALARPARPLH